MGNSDHGTTYKETQRICSSRLRRRAFSYGCVREFEFECEEVCAFQREKTSARSHFLLQSQPLLHEFGEENSVIRKSLYSPPGSVLGKGGLCGFNLLEEGVSTQRRQKRRQQRTPPAIPRPAWSRSGPVPSRPSRSGPARGSGVGSGGWFRGEGVAREAQRELGCHLYHRGT
jgi:hypothetical protein